MTQNESILQYLQQGNSLTSLEALELFRCFRLASRVSDLRQIGHQIESVMEKHGEKHYKRYWIAKEAKQLSFI